MAETLYEHAGGDKVLHHLEELFYEKALADPCSRTCLPNAGPPTSTT